MILAGVSPRPAAAEAGPNRKAQREDNCLCGHSLSSSFRPITMKPIGLNFFWIICHDLKQLLYVNRTEAKNIEPVVLSSTPGSSVNHARIAPQIACFARAVSLRQFVQD